MIGQSEAPRHYWAVIGAPGAEAERRLSRDLAGERGEVLVLGLQPRHQRQQRHQGLHPQCPM